MFNLDCRVTNHNLILVTQHDLTIINFQIYWLCVLHDLVFFFNMIRVLVNLCLLKTVKLFGWVFRYDISFIFIFVRITIDQGTFFSLWALAPREIPVCIFFVIWNFAYSLRTYVINID